MKLKILVLLFSMAVVSSAVTYIATTDSVFQYEIVQAIVEEKEKPKQQIYAMEKDGMKYVCIPNRYPEECVQIGFLTEVTHEPLSDIPEPEGHTQNISTDQLIDFIEALNLKATSTPPKPKQCDTETSHYFKGENGEEYCIAN